MKRNIFAALVVALPLVYGFAAIASADTGALADFKAQYPGNSFGNSCSICHTSPPTKNSYGDDLKKEGGTADNIPPATFLAVEGLDSDGDGFTNIEEINAGTFPGNRASHPSGVTISITDPNGGEIIPSGLSAYTILYDAPTEVSSVKVRYSLDNGATWLPAVGTPGPGSFDWDVPTPVRNTTKALVKVTGFNDSNVKLGSDKSDAPFTIEVVSITAPAADAHVPKGTLDYPVTWTTKGTKNPVISAKVYYTFGSSGIWKLANGTVVDPSGSFNWNVPSSRTTKIVKLKAVLKDASGVTVGTAISKAFTVE